MEANWVAILVVVFCSFSAFSLGWAIGFERRKEHVRPKGEICPKCNGYKFVIEGKTVWSYDGTGHGTLSLKSCDKCKGRGYIHRKDPTTGAKIPFGM